MPRFKPYNYDQDAMVVINYRHQLPAGTFEYAVHYLIEHKLDLSVVEPVFGNIGTAKRLTRFSLRGKRKVQGQWQLYCLVHNTEKLANYGELAA